MKFEVVFAPLARDDFRALRAHVRAEVRDAIDRHLAHEPTKASRSRIKRLRGVRRPQYRLRVGDVRVFYDVVGRRVEVLAIVAKARADEWLQETGDEDEKSSAG